MTIVYYEHQNKETVFNQLLASYWATPHIARSQAPGNLIFQHGYQHNFPTAKLLTSDHMSEAHAKHLEQQQKRK